MDESVFWWGQEMGKSKKRHPTEIRFSPLSLLCLLFCWVGVSGLVFYLGILVGRTEQMREIRRVYRADERAAVEEALPSLSFEDDLPRPDGEPEAVSPLQSKPPLSGPSAQAAAGEDVTPGKVLQIASFRNPEHADRLVRELRQKGYPCFQRLPGPSDSGDEYCRVFVGPLPNEETAEKVKQRLEGNEGFKDILIRSMRKKEGAP
jgi:cell division protein FtsN